MRRLLLVGIAAVAAALPLATVAQAGPAAPEVPAGIVVPDGHKPYLIAHADGVQIYACSSVADGHAWRLLAPWAVLTGDNGNVLGSHYAGPKWEARDGSTVTGARIDGVTVDTTAIPWLLLSATPVADDDPEADRLADTKFIQRVATTGGLAPAAATCTAATAGAVEEIDYTADYYFWKQT